MLCRRLICIFVMLVAAHGRCVWASEPGAVSFDLGDAKVWESSDRAGLETGLDGGVVTFRWAGGVGGADVLTPAQAIPAWPKLKVELEGRVEYRETRWGGRFNPRVVFYDKDLRQLPGGGEVCGWFEEFEYLSLSAEDWRTFIATFDVPKDAAYARVGLNFSWNPVTVRIRKIVLAQGGASPGWMPWSCPPEPMVLRPDEVGRLLASRRKAVPVLKRCGDRTELYVDGKPVVPAVYKSPVGSWGGGRSRFADFEKVGFRIVTVPVLLGGEKRALAGDAYGPVWLGKGKYDFAMLEKAVRDTVAKAPESYLFLEFDVKVYPGWKNEHPDDVFTTSADERARMGSEWLPDLSSERFHSDVKEALREIFAYLETHDAGKPVIGTYLNGGVDGQWFIQYYHDYTPSARAAFREYLRAKYHGDLQLFKTAWGDQSLTFEAAEMPGDDELSPDPFNGKSFADGISPALRRSSDYNQFLSDRNAERAIAFASGVKEGSRGRILCGGYYSDTTHGYPLGHESLGMMLNSKAIDFFSNCPAGRGPGVSPAVLNMAESIRLHGKLLVVEMDFRNPAKQYWPCGDLDFRKGYISTSFWRGLILKFAGMSMARGEGYHLYDMDGGWFDDPETMRLLKELIAIHKQAADEPAALDKRVAVFIDERTPNHTKYRYRTLAYDLVDCPLFAFYQSGVRVGVYLQDDALHPDFMPPRVNIFLNAATMTPSEAEAIRRRFAKDGRVLVWVWAPGALADGGGSNPSMYSGFRLAGDSALFGKPIEVKGGDDPLLKGISGLLGSPSWAAAPRYRVDDPQATVLGAYAGADAPGFAVKRSKNFTEIYIGQPGGFTPELVRNIAREGGVEPLDVNGDAVVAFGSGILMVHSRQSGEKHIRLPGRVTEVKCLTGGAFQRSGSELRFNLDGGSTAIFRVKLASTR